MTELLEGFAAVLTPLNLLYAAIGVTLGTFVGMLPGIGPALTIALLLPVATATTDESSAIGALIMFGGIYSGAMYGGSTTSILLNTPGESNSVATSLEGYQMARRGRARSALATAAIGSFVAGTISVIALSLFAAPLAQLAVRVRASDEFALALLALVSVTALMGKSLLRGMMALTFGLFLGTIGMDSLFGTERLTFWQFDWAEGFKSDLAIGIDITLIIVGLFAIGETIYTAGRLHRLPTKVAPLSTKGSGGWMTREDWRRSWKPWLRGTALGFPFGTLPSGGAEIPTFLSYNMEKRRSKHKEQFGKGAIEGVAGPEAANNSAFTGVLVPLLTLGIPTSATAGVMLAAFNSFDIPAGPSLFEDHSLIVWALIASLYIGNVMLLVLNLPLIKVWVMVLRHPPAAAVRGHPDVRRRRHVRGGGLAVHVDADRRHRCDRGVHAHVRLPDRAGHPRRDHRAHDGREVPQVRRGIRRRPVHLLDPAADRRSAAARGGLAGAAVPAAHHRESQGPQGGEAHRG